MVYSIKKAGGLRTYYLLNPPKLFRLFTLPSGNFRQNKALPLLQKLSKIVLHPSEILRASIVQFSLSNNGYSLV